MIKHKQVIVHYLGYTQDVGGILSHIRKLTSAAHAGRKLCVVHPDFCQTRRPSLKLMRETAYGGEAEAGHVFTAISALPLALRWVWILQKKKHYFFHGHSRLGFFIVMWLRLFGQHRMLASVHCYASHRWLYRWAWFLLRERLIFLSLDMCHYYGLPVSSRMERYCICPPMPELKLTNRCKEVSLPLRVLGLGALEPRKGWHVWVEAVGLLPEHVRRQIRFDHYGNDAHGRSGALYAEQCREDSGRLGKGVHWHGWSDSPWEAYGSAPDLVVMPSINEPFSNVCLEAASRGIPVLVSDRGGIADLIQRGWLHGMYFKQNCAASLAAKLQAIVDNPKCLNKDQVNIELLWERLSATRTMERWAAIYAKNSDICT